MALPRRVLLPRAFRAICSPRTLTVAGLFILMTGHAAVLADHLWHLDRFRTYWGPKAPSILHYCYAVSLFGLIPITWFLSRLRRAGWAAFTEIHPWLPVRAWIYFVFLAIALTSVAHAVNLFQYSEFLTRSFFETTLLACLDMWALLILFQPNVSTDRMARPWRFLDAALVNVVVTLLLMEGTVTLWARYSTSHLPIDATSIEANVALFRQEPYSRYFNFNLNSGGYHDDEFFTATEEDFVVALLSDSFGISVVPYAYTFATVAELRLQDALAHQYKRVAMHNFGIPGINMPEYAFLLHTEVLQTNPDYVVLCVFVGNDIRGFKPKKRMHYVFQNWRIWIVLKGALALWREKAQGGNILKIGRASQEDAAVPQYIHDPEKEPPTFSEGNFLNIESKLLEIANPLNPRTGRKYREFFDALAQFQSWLGNKLIVVVIPDEFQVNDELYTQILATKSSPIDYQRTYAQERIRAFCEKRGIPMLDLLPALRDANKEERVYHLRNTHWNARGNWIAGEAIAEFLLDHLSSSM
ncbi:MAG: hypothetical protein V3R16_07155 [Nitrospirales bacterium]